MKNAICKPPCCVNSGYRIVRHGRGIIKIHPLVDENSSDFVKLCQIAEEFSKRGATVVLTPTMSRPKEFDYDQIYGDLKGTKYYGRCPDMKVGDYWYEHEGVSTGTGKRAFSNMIKRGLEQSDRLILDACGLSDRWMKRSAIRRARLGQPLKELWVRDEAGIRCIFKKQEEP